MSGTLRWGIGLAVALLAGARLPAQWAWRAVPVLTTRTIHTMAYDPDRDRTVMFGGTIEVAPNAPGAAYGDTWEWDGTSWHFRQTPVAPSPRSGHAMAWDPIGHRMILFGGSDGTSLFGDTWAWDGQTWQQLYPAASPPPLLGAAMATDPSRGKVLLFGGYSAWWPNPPALADDMWEWDGTTWTPLHPAHKPSARAGAAMAFVGSTSDMLLFGGTVFLGYSKNETWLWDGQDWRVAQAAVRPPVSIADGMVTDPITGNAFLHINAQSASSPPGSWEWDGTAWTLLTTQVPPYRWPVLAADSKRKEIVMFGGQDTPTGPLDDTWAWDGSQWKQVDVPDVPSGYFQCAYDAARDEIVLTGLPFGAVSGDLETWVQRGSTFTRMHPAVSPPARGGTRWRITRDHAG